MCDIQVDPKEQQSGSDTSTSISCSLCTRSCKRCWLYSLNHYGVASTFFVLFFYILIGGAIFNAVERPNELRVIEEIELARTDAVSTLVQLLVNFTNITEAEALNLTTSIVALGKTASSTLLSEQNPIWDYSSAVFFVSTVVTTIGFGTLAPSTEAGQIIFVFYAVIGIPIALAFLSQIGNIVDKWLNCALRPVERRWGSTISHISGVVILVLASTVMLILIPAAVYTRVETWNYLESVYFTVVTLTTVGFGDFVPGQSIDITGSIINVYKLIGTVWLWLGLAVVSALISEAQGAIEALGAWLHATHCCGVMDQLKLKMSKKQESNSAELKDACLAPVPTNKEEN